MRDKQFEDQGSQRSNPEVSSLAEILPEIPCVRAIMDHGQINDLAKYLDAQGIMDNIEGLPMTLVARVKMLASKKYQQGRRTGKAEWQRKSMLDKHPPAEEHTDAQPDA